MTRQKSFKVRVRARMSKTGESYTTARRHLLNRSDPAPAIAPATDVAMLRKLSDAALHQRTGRGWDAWFARLDAWGATDRTHAEVARWLVAEQQVDNWSAQSITVGYQQARGLRAPGQQANGDFVANATRTVAMPVDRLFDAFVDASLRDRWLPDSVLKVRTATAPKSLRGDWADGSSRIAVWFTPKGPAKTQVAVAHEKLADAAAVAAMKAYWRERLTTLKQLLES